MKAGGHENDSTVDLPEDSVGPRDIRTRVLEDLLDSEVGDVALYYGIARWRGASYPVDAIVQGHPAFALAAARMPRRRLKLPEFVSSSSPVRLRQSEVQGFVEGGRISTRAQLETTLHYRNIWIPFGLEDQTRMLLRDGPNICGWVGLFRRTGNGRFTRSDSRRLSRLASEAKDLLIHAHRVERSRLPAGLADIVLDASGEPQFVSKYGDCWLAQPGFRELLARVIRARDRLDPEDTAETQLIGWADARVVRLHPQRGARLYLVTLKPVSLPACPNVPHLSPRERAVADGLRAGETVKETANRLNIRPDTVKEYRAALFRKLGVSSATQAVACLLALDGRSGHS